MGWNKAEQRRRRAFVSSFALCSSAQQGGVSPGRPRYPSLGMWGWNEGGGGEKGVEVMPRHVYVSVWDEATTQVREGRACSVLVSAIGGDEQFLWSPAGASLAAPPPRHAGGSGLRLFLVFFF